MEMSTEAFFFFPGDGKHYVVILLLILFLYCLNITKNETQLIQNKEHTTDASNSYAGFGSASPPPPPISPPYLQEGRNCHDMPT